MVGTRRFTPPLRIICRTRVPPVFNDVRIRIFLKFRKTLGNAVALRASTATTARPGTDVGTPTNQSVVCCGEMVSRDLHLVGNPNFVTSGVDDEETRVRPNPSSDYLQHRIIIIPGVEGRQQPRLVLPTDSHLNTYKNLHVV